VPNVKLFLTPYKNPADDGDDDVRRFFRTAQRPGDFVTSCFDGVFAQRLLPGLRFLLNPLTHGANQGWWRHMITAATHPYEAVRTVGMYAGAREPSLVIDLDLVDLSHAVDLIRIAANFGAHFDQDAVHVLISQPDEATQAALLQIQQPAGRGRPATSHLANFRSAMLPQTILDEAKAADISALTIDISQHQLQYHYKNADAADEFSKWNNLMSRLVGANILTWNALLFPIGRAIDGFNTSRYDEWITPP
jgi:hypothetical protein